MDWFELDLLFGYTHQIAYSSLSVFSPISLDVDRLMGEQFPVEPVEERHEEVLFTLEPDVVISEVERPSKTSSLCEHEEIFSISNEAQKN